MSTTEDGNVIPIIPNNDQALTEVDSKKSKEMALDYLGKSKALNLNFCDKFSQEALDYSSRAVELNPRLVEAWIELAHCRHKANDLEGAISALEKALLFTEIEDHFHQIVLRKLSAYVRQQSFMKPELKIAAVLRSVDLAKQALKAGLDDGENYYNLAKAYMCLFFVTECVDHQLINLSRSAYQKAMSLAESDDITKNPGDLNERLHVQKSYLNNVKPLLKQSDFLYNYATVLVYCQEFQKALEYLRNAFPLDPDWNEPENLEQCIVAYVKQTYSMYEELNKNQKKVVKRHSKFIEPLKDVERIEMIIELDQQRLQKIPNIKVKSITIDDLMKKNILTSQPDNHVDLLHMKLVNMVNCNQAMYLTFVAMDKNYTPMIVTIYNMAAGTCPGPKDVVTIVNPKIVTTTIENVTPMNIESKNSLSYPRINVREFKDFYVNGFWIKMDQVAKPQYSVSVLP